MTGNGAGVEVFQPFALFAGAEALNGVPKVGDGDTLGQRGITISDTENTGATVRLVSKVAGSRVAVSPRQSQNLQLQPAKCKGLEARSWAMPQVEQETLS